MSNFEDKDDGRIYKFLYGILKFIRKRELEDFIFITFSIYVIIITSWHICNYIYDFYYVVIDIFIIIFSIYVNIYYFLTKIERNDRKFVSTLIKKNFFIKKGKIGYINWAAVSSIGTFTAILMTSITGLISIQLTSTALDISKDMRDISKDMRDISIATMKQEKNNFSSSLLMNGAIFLRTEDIEKGGAVLKNFHNYFCCLMKLPNKTLFKISSVYFVDANKSIDYLKLKYGFDDDNLVYIIKCYLIKHEYILNYEKYFNTFQIMKDYWLRLFQYERYLLLNNQNFQDIGMYFNSYVSEEIICAIYKTQLDRDEFPFERYFTEFYYDKHEKDHEFYKNYVENKLKIFEEIGNEDDFEYVLFKNMQEYLNRHQNPIAGGEDVKEDTNEK